MNIILNNKMVDLFDSLSLMELLNRQGIDSKGIAIAVNNRVVPRVKWGETMLNDEDKVTVIRATCGG